MRIKFFEGRIDRQQYMWVYFGCFLASNVCSLLFDKGFTYVVFLLFFVIIPLRISAAAKRCHDLGHNGWWQFIPFYGFWLILAKGEPFPNKYGDVTWRNDFGSPGAAEDSYSVGAPSLPPESSSDLFFYIDQNSQRQGPVAIEELKGCGVTATTLVWKQGMPAWKKAIALPELYALFAEEYNQSFMPHNREQECPSLAEVTEADGIGAQISGEVQIQTELQGEEFPTSSAETEGTVPDSVFGSMMDLLRTDNVMSEFVERHPNGFILSLMVLSTFIISSDGIVMKTEMNYLDRFLHDAFGEDIRDEYMPLIPRIMSVLRADGQDAMAVKLQHVCEGVRKSLELTDRELLMDFLEGVASADGLVSAEEQALLLQIKEWIQ